MRLRDRIPIHGKIRFREKGGASESKDCLAQSRDFEREHTAELPKDANSSKSQRPAPFRPEISQLHTLAGQPREWPPRSRGSSRPSHVGPVPLWRHGDYDTWLPQDAPRKTSPGQIPRESLRALVRNRRVPQRGICGVRSREANLSICVEKRDGFPPRRYPYSWWRRENSNGVSRKGAILIRSHYHAHPPIMTSMFLDGARLELPHIVFSATRRPRSPSPFMRRNSCGSTWIAPAEARAAGL